MHENYAGIFTAFTYMLISIASIFHVCSMSCVAKEVIRAVGEWNEFASMIDTITTDQ